MPNLEKRFESYGTWLSKQIKLHKESQKRHVQRMNVLKGEIYYCDFGYNIGEEKLKKRPALVISSNKINSNGSKILVAAITDADGKVILKTHKPAKNTWYLLYSSTTDPNNMYSPGRPMKGISYSCFSKDSMLQLEEMRYVSKARLDAKIGVIDPADLKAIGIKLNNVFDF